MNFDVRAPGNKSTRDEKLVSKTVFLSSDPDELCKRLKSLLGEKHAGNNTDITSDEGVAIVDELLEYKRISKKHHRQILKK